MNPLYQITSSYFCAGIERRDNHWVGRTAPIIKYMQTWTWYQVDSYCNRKGWKLISVK